MADCKSSGDYIVPAQWAAQSSKGFRALHRKPRHGGISVRECFDEYAQHRGCEQIFLRIDHAEVRAYLNGMEDNSQPFVISNREYCG